MHSILRLSDNREESDNPHTCDLDFSDKPREMGFLIIEEAHFSWLTIYFDLNLLSRP
jgi:hypothetical protein